MTRPFGPLRSAKRQRGTTLVVALIMLVLLTMLAMTTLGVGRSSLLVTGNAQSQAVVQAAAQQMLNQIISNRTFVDNPAAVLDNSNCPPSFAAPANSRCVNVNGDLAMLPTDENARHFVMVALNPAPTCVQVRPIPTSQLNLFNPEDLGCSQGVNNQNFGIAGAGALSSLCSNTMWEITAIATDPTTGARATVTEGVSMRVSTDNVATSCP